jgi:hypothetical protein
MGKPTARSGLGFKMIRTIWLATVCLAVLSTFAVGKAVLTRTSASATERPTDLTTLGTGPTRETLGKADRLEVTDMRPEAPPAAELQPIEPVAPAVALAVAPPPPVENKIISRHWRDPNAFSSATKPKQARQAVSGKKGKIVDRKGNQAADRSKAAPPAKPCGRPGAVGDLLKSLNLSPACDS